MTTLRSLLNWANTQYLTETPELQHSLSLTDDGGAPDMKAPAKRWLGLTGRRCQARESDDRAVKAMHRDCIDGCHLEPDNHRRAAYAVDQDGKYRTPFLRAVEEIADPARRLFVKWLCVNTLRPSDVARHFDIPDWCQGDVAFRSLEMVRQKYRTEPPVDTRPGWVSMSESSRRAIEAGERDAA